MKRAVLRTWAALKRLLRPREHSTNPVRTIAVDELPDELQPNRLYLLGTPPWSAAIVCPCGCQELIHLSLLPDDSPAWRLRLDGNALPSLAPSVWRTKGCQAHFFLRHGEIFWFRPYEE